MHPSSMALMGAFRDVYLEPYKNSALDILDLGSALAKEGQSSYRQLFDRKPWRYVGADVCEGDNVDVVFPDPYHWAAIKDSSFDVVVSGQAFEHIEYIWVSILEVVRVLKPNGIAIITAPAAGPIHRYPADCWRFYPDGLPALSRYANLRVIEAHVQRVFAYPERHSSLWCDAAVIAQRPELNSDETAELLRRIDVGRQLLQKPLHESVQLQAVPRSEFAPSPIQPVENSLNALTRLEESRLKSTAELKTRIWVAFRQLRGMIHTLRTPVSKNFRI